MARRQQDRVHIPEAKRRLAFAFALVTALLRLRAACGHRQRSSPRKAVVLEPFGMGDVLSLQPMVQILREHDYEVAVCAREEWEPLLAPELVSAWVPARFPWNRYTTRRKYSPQALFDGSVRASIRDLRTHALNSIGIDPRGDVRSLAVLYLAGCRCAYSLSHYLGSDLPVPSWTARTTAVSMDRPRWQVNLSLLGRLDPSMDTSTASRPSVRHLANGHAPDPRLVAFIPVAPWPGKSWGREKWNRLASRLREKGHRVRVLCGPGQQTMAGSILDRGTADVQPCNDVREWVHALEAAAGVVSLNTGPMHIADALGRPLVLVNGSSSLPLWAPSGPRSAIANGQDGLSCAPCHEIGDPACSLACFENVTPDDVYRRLTHVLDHAGDLP